MFPPDSPIARPAESFPDDRDKGWDFMELMNTDIRQLEIRKSLRKLGNVKVIEWDFKTVLPKVHELAYQEVDVAGLFRKIARIGAAGGPPVRAWQVDEEELRRVGRRLSGFLEFVTRQLVEQPDHARIDFVQEPPNLLRYDVVLVKRDAAMLIGTGGHTAEAIRNVLKAAAERAGLQVRLRILSHEEAAALAGH